MAWNEQWSYRVKVAGSGGSGTELNDRTTMFCEIPELDNIMSQDIVMAPLAGDYPVFIRSQPTEGRLTFNIALRDAGAPGTYRSRIDALKALFAHNTKMKLTVQARGMAETKSLYFYVEGSMTDYKRRLISFRVLAPKPVLE